MNTPDYKKLNGGAVREESIKCKYPEFYDYLIKTYPQDLPFKEKLYWYFNGLNELPTCATCGGKVKFENIKLGYRKYCCTKCLNSNPDKKESVKKTCVERYGGVAPACSKDVRDKMITTNIEKYGVENAMQNKDIAQKSHNTNIERYGGMGNSSKVLLDRYKQSNFELYGAENVMQSDYGKKKIKETLMERYEEDHQSKVDSVRAKLKAALNNSIVREKINNTKRLNNSFHISGIEHQFENYLKSNNIEYKTQYNTKNYPWNCDFYIPKYDLYIEIQGSWTHGGHPYNEIEDEEMLQGWVEKSKNSQFYKNAIETWTVRDVKKRTFAKNHNLNYLEFFSSKIETAISTYERFIESMS